MNSATFPVCCGLALAAMAAAGASHWWTVRTFAATMESGAPTAVVADVPEAAPTAPPPAAPTLAAAPASTPSSTAPPAGDAAQREFFESLIAEIRGLRGENRDLRDQMAETNRDLMKLEFRVDTHSESFRPLPVSETRFDTTYEDSPGVLPPRMPRDFSFDLE